VYSSQVQLRSSIHTVVVQMSRIAVTLMASVVPLEPFPGSPLLCLSWKCFFSEFY
jgi:hypothetical protein